jgi:hypothetical protein
MAIADKSREGRLPHGVLALCLLGLIIGVGCQAAPPHYHSTWHRATSARHGFAAPPCHGFTPTYWSRWPDECQVYGGPHFEEIALPAELPTDSESDAAQQPDHRGDRQIPEPEFPPEFQPTAPGTSPAESETKRETSLRESGQQLSPQTWSLHLVGYLKAVTRLP